MSIGSYNAFGSNLTRRQNFANSSNRSYYSSIGSNTKSDQLWWNYADNGKNTLHNHRALLYGCATRGEEEVWDLSDSLADLYSRVNEENAAAASSFTIHRDHSKDVDVKKWINEDTSHGFIRVYVPNGDISTSRLFPCTLRTTAQRVCMQCGIPANSLHVQFNGDIITRMEPIDHPLAVQNEFLGNLGYSEPRKIQEQGYNNELHYLVKFYSGKPVEDNTYSRNQLSSILFVRKGKLIYQWVQRFCSISGTRLFIHRDKYATSKKSVMQLAKGYVEEVKFKDHPYVLKLTSTLQGDRSLYLSFLSVTLYNKWLKRAQKATAKLPTKADLSKCHLEFLPEALFINEDLRTLNLRHNALRERPIEEDIYNIGWLDDLPRFHNLCSLNLANNDLKIFPLAVCNIRSLVELNMASNKLEDIPAEIVELFRLQILRLHNNHLTTLPEEMSNMKRLSVLILAFNHFTTVPQVLLRLHGASETMDSIIMAGNYIERLPGDLLSRMKLIKKIDFRMNRLTLVPSEIAKFQCLEFMTHLDIRDNHIQNLDIRALKGLVYVNCERNSMYSLQLSGVGLKYLYAAHNELNSLNITPKPEWLIDIDISHNNLAELPSWLAECFFMAKLDVSHNQLTQLPSLIFTTAKKLQDLRANHNLLKELPTSVGNVVLEMLQLQHNNLCSLPPTLLTNANKLKCLNLTKNFLRFLPQPNQNESLNKLQELYLTANKLQDNVFQVISCFPRLKKLHLAENIIEEIPESCIAKLETLQELNISSNCLTHLPPSLCSHPKLQILRANSNMIFNLPDFKGAPELKVLEVGFNCLYDLSVTHLMNSQVSLLDISGNPNLFVDAAELEGLKHKKRVCMIDMRGQNRSLSHQPVQDEKKMPWQSGFSQTSGMRNKLCVAILNKTKFNRTNEDALFGIFDGGRSDEVALLLADIMEETVLEELNCPLSPSGGTSYMKYAMLSAHRKLKSTGQKMGASAAVCHLRKLPDGRDGSTKYWITVANVGMVRVVLSRNGQALPLTHCFSVGTDRSECMRIQKSDGIITEDGRVNGITECTRLLGSGYLFPQVIPKPHVKSVMLQPDDQFIIIANHELWKYVTIEEAVKHIAAIHDPIMSAKALQDLAQGYGASENLSIMVINLAPTQAPHVHALPSSLLRFPQFGSDALGAMASKLLHDKIFRSKDGSPLTPSSLRSIVETNEDEVTPTNSKEDVRPENVDKEDIYGDCDNPDPPPYIKVKPPPTSKGRFRKKDDVHEWENLLQQRLAEEVKNKELNKELHSMIVDCTAIQRANGFDGETDAPQADSNWSTMEQQALRASAEGKDQQGALTLANLQAASIETSETSTESPDDDRLYDIPVGIDRDAILFYKMQMARINSGKTGSLSSVQSDPMYASLEELAPKRVPSHSIEVLVRAIPNLSRTASLVEKHPASSTRLRPPPPTPPPLPPPLLPTVPGSTEFSNVGTSSDWGEQPCSDSNELLSNGKDNEILYSVVDKSSVPDPVPPEANLAVPYITLPQSWANQPPLPPTPTSEPEVPPKKDDTKSPSQQSIIISYL